MRVVPVGRGRASCKPGDRGVGGVGDVHCARRSASTRSTCRPCRSTGRGPGRDRSWSSSHCSLVADWFGRESQSPRARSARHVADGAQVLPTDPRADRLAGRAVPHDRRRRAGWRCRPRRRVRLRRARRARSSSARGRHRGRVELHDAVGRAVGEQLAGDLVRRTVASARTTAARTLLVPTSMTSTVPFGIGLTARRGRRTGVGSPSLPGLRMPFGSRACFTRTQHVEARAERVGDEPGPVQPDAVVVAQRATRRRAPRAAPRPTPRGSTRSRSSSGGRPAKVK